MFSAAEEAKRILLARGLEQVPHAILLAGPAGVGKTELADQLVSALLCEAPSTTHDACGTCPSCRWLAAGNHPDFRRVSPGGDADADSGEEFGVGSEKAKKRSTPLIKIDQIRALEDFVFLGSHRHGRRVVMVTDADAMNSSAANALLKILEEPPAEVYFVLLSSKWRYLLATIRSRCRFVPLGRPKSSEAIAWLASRGLEKEGAAFLGLSSGAPMQVAQWKEDNLLKSIGQLVDSLAQPHTDPLVLAAQWDSLLKGTDGQFRMEHLVEGVQRWLFDLTQEVMAGQVRYHSNWPRPKLEKSPSPIALMTGWDELLRFRRSARHPLNQLLFLEDMASRTLKALRPVAP